MRGQVKVKPEVARLVEFKRINLKDARWPLEGLFDVIFFRNALIYFNQDTQDIFLRKMVRYLKPRGYLFLGNSEHIPWLHDDPGASESNHVSVAGYENDEYPDQRDAHARRQHCGAVQHLRVRSRSPAGGASTASWLRGGLGTRPRSADQPLHR